MRRLSALIRYSALLSCVLVAGLFVLSAFLEPATCPGEESASSDPAKRIFRRLTGMTPGESQDMLLQYLSDLSTREALAQPLETPVPSRITGLTAPRVQFSPVEATQPPVELPAVLIYHTHTHEAYDPKGGTAYVEKTGSWRTTDEDFNIVKVGATLADALRALGFTVYHDRSDYEVPKLSGAYDRSLAGVEKFLEEHPEVTVFLDIHRDAYTAGRVMRANVEGTDCAQIMFVVGSGESTGFSDLPDLASNKALAQRAMDELSLVSPDLVRRMSNKTGRYNQHLSSSCMLIEVGHNLNTLEEALASIPHLARALRSVLTPQSDG